MGDEALLGFDLSILSGRQIWGDVIDGLSLPAAPEFNLVPSQQQEELISLPESHRASRLARAPQGRLRSIEITDYRLQFILADGRRAWMEEKLAAVISKNFHKQVGWGDSL